MILVGWALLGVALGAAGSELLRTCRPELVEKVENAAKRVVDSLCSAKPADEEAEQNMDDGE